MKRFASALLAGGVALALSAAPAAAQYVFLGGGLNLPMGDFKDASKTGWLATGGVGFDIGDKGLWLEAEGYFGSHKAKATGGAKLDLMGGLGAIGYTFSPGKSMSPYVLAGAGILAAKSKVGTVSSTESQFAYSGAVGLSFKAGAKLNLWLEGRYLATKDFSMIPITAGVTINFK